MDKIKSSIQSIITNKNKFSVEYINNKKGKKHFVVKKIKNSFFDHMSINIEHREGFDISTFSGAFSIKYDSIISMNIIQNEFIELSEDVKKKDIESNLFNEIKPLGKQPQKSLQGIDSIQNQFSNYINHTEYTKAYIMNIYDGDGGKLIEENAGDYLDFRIIGIDAPENNEPYAEESKDRLSELVVNTVVFIKKYGKDKYGRTLVELFIDINASEDKGTNIGIQLLKEGLAILLLYKKNPNIDMYKKQSKEASDYSVGIRNILDNKIFELTTKEHNTQEIEDEINSKKTSYIGKYLSINHTKTSLSNIKNRKISQGFTTLLQGVDKYQYDEIKSSISDGSICSLKLNTNNARDSKAIEVLSEGKMLGHIADPNSSTGKRYISKYNKLNLWNNIKDNESINCIIQSIKSKDNKVFIWLKINNY